jgi:hypothetical protein
MSGAEHWVDRLQNLAARFPQFGIGQDLAGLAIADLWGLWRFLERLAQEASNGPAP